MNFTMTFCMWVGWAVVILLSVVTVFEWKESRQWAVFLGAQAGILTAALIGQLVATQMACGSILGCDPPPAETIEGFGEFVMWVFVGGLPMLVVGFLASLSVVRLKFLRDTQLHDTARTNNQEPDKLTTRS